MVSTAMEGKELELEWSIEQDERGITAKRRYLVPQNDIWSGDLPHIGEAWPGPPYSGGHDLSKLICKAADWEAYDCDLARATYYYTTGGALSEEAFQLRTDFDVETTDITRGFRWEHAGTPVTVNVPTLAPVERITLRMRREPPVTGAIRSAIGKVNSKTFLGYEHGCIRFDGACTERSYDRDGRVATVETIFTFTGRAPTHNTVWREPLQARDSSGNPVFYQNADASHPYYTTDPTLVGTPVYVPGEAGIGGWDKPYTTVEGVRRYRYETCDFATVLGING